MKQVAGIDFGRRADASVASVLAVRDERLELVAFVRLIDIDWTTQLSLLTAAVVGSSPILADATGVGDALYERIPNATGVILVGSRGESANRVKIKKGRLILPVRDLLTSLVSAIVDKRLVVKCHCPGLYDELVNLAISFTRLGSLHFSARTGHDDAVFSLALAVYAARIRRDWSDKAQG